MAERGLEDKAALLHRRHLVGIVDVGFGSERHPPGAFDHGDVPSLVVKVRMAAASRRELIPRDVDAGFARIAEDCAGLDLVGVEAHEPLWNRLLVLAGSRD